MQGTRNERTKTEADPKRSEWGTDANATRTEAKPNQSRSRDNFVSKVCRKSGRKKMMKTGDVFCKIWRSFSMHFRTKTGAPRHQKCLRNGSQKRTSTCPESSTSFEPTSTCSQTAITEENCPVASRRVSKEYLEKFANTSTCLG